MKSSFKSYINLNLYNSNGIVSKVIQANVVFFIFLLICKIILSLSNYPHYYQTICDYLYLTTPWQTALHKPWTLITYFLVHTNVFTLIFILINISILGRTVLYILGPKAFGSLYILGNIFGGIFFLLFTSYLPAIKSQHITLYSSTAGLYALLTALATFAPNFSFRFFLLGDFKSKYIVFFCAMLKLLDLANGQLHSLASIGGMLYGYLYIKLFHTNHSISRIFNLIISILSTNFFKLNKVKKSKVKKGNIYFIKDKAATYTKEEIDNILDKISKDGYSSLSEEEKYKLFNYAKK
jgi:membrane associated rhomboid family serine protease